MSNSRYRRNQVKPLSIVATIVASLLIASSANAAVVGGRTITVSGAATIYVTPDRAVIVLGVSKNAQSAAGALSAASDAMSKVIAALKAAGTADRDLQTSQISLDVRSDLQDRPIGYTATEGVSVTVRDLSQVGTLIDKGVAAGANQVSGPEFSKSNQDAVYRHALANAYSQALAKAQALAARAGVRLGRPGTISESVGSTPVPLGAAAAKSSAPTPVQPGQLEVDASVTVSFPIR
jgi:uncharacterized protein YggE